MGVEIRYAEPVESLEFEGRRIRAVRTARDTYAADATVVNADFARTMTRLVPDRLRRRWSDRRIASKRFSCSTFMLYLGVEGELPDVPSLYIQNPCVTDPSLAPPGHAALYILVPVPNLRHGADWSVEGPRYRDIAIQRLKVLGLHDLESRIRYERMVSPQDWQDEFSVGFGATFNLSHDLMQMLSFRPRNRFNDTQGFYLVGGGTHPGCGLPVIYEGARISTDLLLQDLGLARSERSPRHMRAGAGAFPSQVESLGGSENATKHSAGD